MNSRGLSACMALFIAGSAFPLLQNGEAYGHVAFMDHPVFSKYPSPEELQRAVEEFKASHSEKFEAAMRNFATAVRRNLKERRPPDKRIVRQEWRLWLPPLRPEYESVSDAERIRSMPEWEEWFRFYREHVDELTLEYVPALRIVALDVILNGWDVWDEWNNDRLKGYRERYPDIDRLAAVHALQSYDGWTLHQCRIRGEPEPAEQPLDVTGLYLRMLVDPKVSAQLRNEVSPPITRIRNDIDALDFLVKWRLRREEATAPIGSGIIQGLSQGLGKEGRRDFWLPYLNHPDTDLRRIAVIEIGTTRTRPRDVPPQAHPDWEIVQRLLVIAENDPDESVRNQANYAIKWRLLDDRPPRGHVTYDKEEK
jgi:hypothetical protein